MQTGTPTQCRIQNLQVKLATKPKLALLAFIALISEKCKKQTRRKKVWIAKENGFQTYVCNKQIICNRYIYLEHAVELKFGTTSLKLCWSLV